MDQTSSSVRCEEKHPPTENPARSRSTETDWPDRSGLLDNDDRKTIETKERMRQRRALDLVDIVPR
ncbi:hypothetical protein EVC45_22975 [Paraburkholderia sp. UYCP14C]|uniref:hypothetical protein n=1 Tax=Paraburkholderia sp. UYCP14C TaxID=2511130 RepID=UPI00102284B6|nr:hypothetical protein [Paraburkholderia sp. UYCP14C]RZF27446.1 hypothetical protein EVC45_22975 [Paraburkholderia sp. UYCP14C]